MRTPETVRAEFERLLEEHGGIVRKVAYAYARNKSDRNDLMQEIALQLWRAFPRYQPNRSFSTWTYRIALNISISFLRKHSRPGRETVEFNETQHAPKASSVAPEMDERIALLHRLIADCRPLDRALLLLYLDDCSHREIASVLGLTESNVATKLSRLKENFRLKLTRTHD